MSEHEPEIALIDNDSTVVPQLQLDAHALTLFEYWRNENGRAAQLLPLTTFEFSLKTPSNYEILRSAFGDLLGILIEDIVYFYNRIDPVIIKSFSFIEGQLTKIKNKIHIIYLKFLQRKLYYKNKEEFF